MPYITYYDIYVIDYVIYAIDVIFVRDFAIYVIDYIFCKLYPI